MKLVIEIGYLDIEEEFVPPSPDAVAGDQVRLVLGRAIDWISQVVAGEVMDFGDHTPILRYAGVVALLSKALERETVFTTDDEAKWFFDQVNKAAPDDVNFWFVGSVGGETKMAA